MLAILHGRPGSACGVEFRSGGRVFAAPHGRGVVDGGGPPCRADSGKSSAGHAGQAAPGCRPAICSSAVNDVPVRRISDFERELYVIGPFGDAHYTIMRDGIPLEAPVLVIPDRQDRSMQQALRVIGLIYLAIGIYVLFRRWTAPRATHFYVFCLVSFALYALKYTGVMDGLDSTVYWCNVLAEALQPALFVHFALSFPEEQAEPDRGAHGCCRWFIFPARPYWACGCMRGTTGKQRSCCPIALTRWAPLTTPCFTCWLRDCSCAVMLARARRCCGSS